MDHGKSMAEGTAKSRLMLRYSLATRLLHWTIAGSIFVLLWSGFWIFDVHPRLYWGDVGHDGMPALAELAADTSTPDPKFMINIGSHSWDVTGRIGEVVEIPGLGSYTFIANFPEGFQYGGNRGLHFTAAWVLVFGWLLYALHLVISGLLRGQWLPRRGELSPRAIGRDILDHLRFRRARGEEGLRYNILQKLTYLAVIFGLLPLMILTGLAMSNGITAAWPGLVELFGGRQSARTLHFIAASLVLLFIAVHLFELFVSGFFNRGRSMITGRFRVEQEAGQ